jgi:hypothetical protein
MQDVIFKNGLGEWINVLSTIKRYRATLSQDLSVSLSRARTPQLFMIPRITEGMTDCLMVEFPEDRTHNRPLNIFGGLTAALFKIQTSNLIFEKFDRRRG